MAENDGSDVTGGGLRAQLEAALAKNKDLETRLNSYEAAQRANVVRETLIAKGAKPGTEAFYPANADVTETAIEKWLNDNATLFKLSEAPIVPQTNDALGNRPDAARAREQGRLLQANDLSNAPRSAGDLSDISEAIGRAKTRAELEQVYRDWDLISNSN